MSFFAGFKESTPGDDVIELLKTHEYFRGVNDAVLDEIARFGTITHYNAAAIVHELNDALASICFVLRGRLKAVRGDSPTSGGVEPGQTHCGRYYRCSRLGLGGAFESSRLRPGIHSAG